MREEAGTRRIPAIDFTRLLSCHIAFRSSRMLCDPFRSLLTICLAPQSKGPRPQVKLLQLPATLNKSLTVVSAHKIASQSFVEVEYDIDIDS